MLKQPSGTPGGCFVFLDFIHVLPKYLKRDEDSIALVVNKPVHRVREIKVS
jgi:hypothetical protein